MRLFGIVLLAALAAGPVLAAGGQPPAAYTPAYLADRAQIEDVISALALNVDLRRWDEAKATLADRVQLGYPADKPDGTRVLQTSTVTADQFIASSKSVLPGYLHTQHIVTNPIVTVEGDKARVVAQMLLSHYLPSDQGEPYWIVVGNYDYELARTPQGWRITLMHVNKQFELGNLKLPELAARRVAAGQIATTP